MSKFEFGEWVLLTSQKGKKWLVRVDEAPYSSHLGGIHLGDIAGREEGDWLVTSKGAKLMLFRPSLQDFIFSMKRHTQIIYPKDLSAMIFYGDVYPGCNVLETGIGSGALALALLRAMCGRGKLVSVEKRAEFALQARENIRLFFGGEAANHDIIIADIENVSIDMRNGPHIRGPSGTMARHWKFGRNASNGRASGKPESQCGPGSDHAQAASDERIRGHSPFRTPEA